ncbi:hypothetical protein KJ365_11740 [Glaciecola sp. XM2]|jgi:hypothetical protein|uniref:hypothetical protein n=1 Tax=Glaciecola sp. XM2 TaxID=1914931 RepID=UPI001BDF5209|nr:hypothetical protein [Glaciecola sp. XM2]MBT1451553.1 hypothetical protein [Glaciecola sp. XM2]
MQAFRTHKPISFRKQGTLIASAIALSLLSSAALADSLSQAKRMHDRLAGVPGSQATLNEMANLIDQGQIKEAAYIAMQAPSFYNVTVKNWVTPWTNEEADIFAALNDYTATVIGMVRDDVDFRLVLSGDIIYTAQGVSGIPGYSVDNNAHYEALENNGIDLSTALVQSSQSSVTGLPVEATAGVMTTRGAAKSFFKDGTNRAMLRFTLMNHLCADLEAFKDTSLPPDRIRQDLSRSPGGDSRIFANSCTGCHNGMDPLAQAYAYYEYQYNVDSDPEGQNGRITYNGPGQIDPQTNSRVTAKHQINANNFSFGYIITDDRWDNYWREGINQTVGWSDQLSGFGYGAKSMGEELANSEKFAQCQVTKVFENVCLRSPQDSSDRAQISAITNNFVASNYSVKEVFADTASYCRGE